MVSFTFIKPEHNVKALAVTLALLPLLPSRSGHTTSEAPGAPTTQSSHPTSQPAGHDATMSVHRGTLTTAVDAQGYFEPVDALDVRIRPKAYGGELPIASLVENGAAVHKGDVILQIDTTTIDKQIAAAEGEDAVSHANLTKSEADAKLGEEQDALALRMQTDTTTHAQDEVKWYENVDGPNLLAGVDLEMKGIRAFVEDQEDELNELKKMYKDDDLTNDTKDIVVKRAVRRLEMSKAELKMDEERATKIKTFIYPVQRQRVHDSAKQAEEALESLKTAQSQTKVLRDTGLKAARAAASAVDLKLSDLKADREKLAVRAPDDGVVLYGQFAGGGFNPIDPRLLRVGEHIPPQQILMTFYTPGHLRLHLDLAEQKFFALHAGLKATLTPAVFPEQKIEATCDTSPAQPVNMQQGPMYPITVSCRDVDAKIVPGMRANFHADAPEAQNVLLVPNSAIADSCVWLKTEDGDREKRHVVTGKSDGKQTEIKQGLSEGDQIFVEAQK